jgi:hypothetical protein
MPAFLILGFVIDSITLRRVDLLPETILVYAYLLLAGGSVLLMHLKQSGAFTGLLSNRMEPLLPLASSYAFGSLFSAFAVFYAKSASIADSWPFIAVLLGMVVGLEVFKEYRGRLVFNLSVFFLAIFSFSIFSVPLWMGKLGTEIFLLSAVVAIGIFSFFCLLIYAAGRKLFTQNGNVKNIGFSVAGILTAMMILYTTNTLPPIPLVLKDIGVYHYIAKDTPSPEEAAPAEHTVYRMYGEVATLWDRLFGITVHWVKNEPIYVFSSVFTPVAIETDIVHRWEYWSTLEEDWVFSNEVPYPSEGGREEGYRGYSWKRGVFPGTWRVTVETPDGLKIGRIEFTVVEVVQVPHLESSVR